MARAASWKVVKKALREYIISGDSRKAGRAVGYSHQAVLNWAREHGLPIPPPGGPPKSLRLRRKIYMFWLRNGKDFKLTAHEFGVEKTKTIQNLVKWVESLESMDGDEP